MTPFNQDNLYSNSVGDSLNMSEFYELLSDMVENDLISMCWEDEEVKYFMTEVQLEKHQSGENSEFY